MALMCVREGERDFKPQGVLPFEIPWVLPSNVKFKWKFRFYDSCVYPDQGDADLRNDWNKGGGMSKHLFVNNKNSAMWAWRSAYEMGKVEVSPYFNKDGDNLHSTYGSLFFSPYEWGECEIWRKRKNWNIMIYAPDQNLRINAVEKLGSPWLVKRIGGWHGGWDNDNNGLGGVAPQDMCFEAKFGI